jgi:hypothetical protein
VRPAITDSNVYGLVAEYSEPEDVTSAANIAREAGYKAIDAYTPFPIEGLDTALGMEPTRLGWIVLIAGILGGLGGFFMQWFANVEFYPLNLGGKPLNSWPNFVVITFECAVLISAFTAGLFMLGRNGLPRAYHPIFNTPNFEAATRDRFFLCIEARDEKFDLVATKEFLDGTAPNSVSEVDL